MKTFKVHKDVVFNNKAIGMEIKLINNGIQMIYTFENGYGASVVSHDYSYGEQGSWELAVLDEGHLTYDTPITSDVLGYLSMDDVIGILDDIKRLVK